MRSAVVAGPRAAIRSYAAIYMEVLGAERSLAQRAMLRLALSFFTPTDAVEDR